MRRDEKDSEQKGPCRGSGILVTDQKGNKGESWQDMPQMKELKELKSPVGDEESRIRGFRGGRTNGGLLVTRDPKPLNPFSIIHNVDGLAKSPKRLFARGVKF